MEAKTVRLCFTLSTRRGRREQGHRRDYVPFTSAVWTRFLKWTVSSKTRNRGRHLLPFALIAQKKHPPARLFSKLNTSGLTTRPSSFISSFPPSLLPNSNRSLRSRGNSQWCTKDFGLFHRHSLLSSLLESYFFKHRQKDGGFPPPSHFRWFV